MATGSIKSIAEFYIRRWIEERNINMNWFSLSIEDGKGKLEDRDGNTMTLVYDNFSKTVYIGEE